MKSENSSQFCLFACVFFIKTGNPYFSSHLWLKIKPFSLGQQLVGRHNGFEEREMVLRLYITNCAGSCHSSEHRRTTVNAMDVPAKTFFERLYLVPGSRVKHLCAPTPPPFAKLVFLDFCEILWTLNFFGLHDSNLAKSRYPRESPVTVTFLS